MSQESHSSSSSLLHLPYSARQVLVVQTNTVVKEARAAPTGPPISEKQRKMLNSDGLFRVLGEKYKAFARLQSMWELAEGDYWRYRDYLHREVGESSPILITLEESAKLKLPPGHPRLAVGYVGHPVVPACYYPFAHFHRFVFESKCMEAIRLLMALGAQKFEVEHLAGWSSAFSSKLHLSIPATIAGAKVSAESSTSHQLLFKGNLPGNVSPKVPDDVAWFPSEPAWQEIANARINFGLTDFSLFVRYEDDYGINATLKSTIAKAGFDVGGQFESHQSTVWRIHGKFAPPPQP